MNSAISFVLGELISLRVESQTARYAFTAAGDANMFSRAPVIPTLRTVIRAGPPSSAAFRAKARISPT
jgi:hypothetical protein